MLLLVSGSRHHACASSCVMRLAITCERLPLSYIKVQQALDENPKVLEKAMAERITPPFGC